MEDRKDTKEDGTEAGPPPAPLSSETTGPGGNEMAVDPSSVRGSVGIGMHRFTQAINENLVAARYGVFAGVTLLTVYGLSQTPLFFRYRTVADIPASSFIGRQRLYGRIIGVDAMEGGNGTGCIQIQVRHLSPIGQILPKSWLDFLLKFSPQASRLGSNKSITKPEENARDLLKVKIAGIHPPPVSSLTYKPEEFLDRLARERKLVSCQLLARQVESSDEEEKSRANKRPMSEVMPELAERGYENSDSEKTGARPTYKQQQEVAICRVTYRPSFFQFFPTDIAESLVSTGNANVSSNILGREMPDSKDGSSTSINDSSERLQDLQNDVKYLDRLANVEFEAAQQSMGMWSVPEVRASKREVIDEVEFQAKAGILQKLWRWVRSE